MTAHPPFLSLESLKHALRGAAAMRLRLRLQPAGGPGAKVSPPTYLGGVYVFEERRLPGGDATTDGERKSVKCVLLDSVQSQANRLELALLDSYREGRLKFPLLSVDFSQFPEIGEVTSLDAPHRIFDAILRDSTLGGNPFRPQPRAKSEEAPAPAAAAKKKAAKGAAAPSSVSEAASTEGVHAASANVRYATPLLELCPTALVFGAWDSTGAAGGLGNKFPRALVSEIIGVGAVEGARPSSRIDPLGIESGAIYEGEDGCYVADPAEAKKNDKGELKLFQRSSKDKGRPSEVNHGNVAPDVERAEGKAEGKPIRGGVTFDYAEQTTVLSLAALRRLRFPSALGGASKPEADHAARTLLAALGLAAIAHQMDPPDYFLRSNCQLVLEGPASFELIGAGGGVERFALDAESADRLFAQAAKDVKAAGLPWREEKIVLQPKKALLDLVRRSRELGGGEE